jgi:hypothetical protein
MLAKWGSDDEKRVFKWPARTDLIRLRPLCECMSELNTVKEWYGISEPAEECANRFLETGETTWG